MFGFLKKKDASQEAMGEGCVVDSDTAITPERTYTNAIGMEFIYLDGGTFQMGRNELYHEGGETETPVHAVTVKSFWISKYPVTQEQYFKLTRVNPSHFKNDKVLEENSKKHPVEQVNWFDAKAFVEILNRYEGRFGFYALPSEAQWEYAAKAGGNSRFGFGDCEALLDDYAAYVMNSPGMTVEVDSKLPNRLGIASLIGNVWEWCEDDFYPNYEGAPADGSARLGNESTGSFKVRRGGSFKTDYLCLRSSFRGYSRPDLVSNDVGIRVVINGDPHVG